MEPNGSIHCSLNPGKIIFPADSKRMHLTSRIVQSAATFFSFYGGGVAAWSACIELFRIDCSILLQADYDTNCNTSHSEKDSG